MGKSNVPADIICHMSTTARCLLQFDGTASPQGLEAPKQRAMMLLHQQSISVDEVAKVLDDYAETVGDTTKQQDQGGNTGDSADGEAAAAAEATSIRALASILK